MGYYVAKFDFEAGEVGVPFIQGVKARDAISANRKVRQYMHRYYESQQPDGETEKNWEWYDIGVRVKLSEITEVKDFDSLWRETMPIR